MYAALGLERYSTRTRDIVSKIKLHRFGGFGGSVKITNNYGAVVRHRGMQTTSRDALGWGRVVLNRFLEQKRGEKDRLLWRYKAYRP